MTVYKVVKREQGKLVSAIIHYPIKIEYKLKKKTKPDIGCIFAFNNLLDAKIWLDNLVVKAKHRFIILKCEAEINKRSIFFYIPRHPSYIQAESFWRNGRVNEWSRWKVPDGTILCDSITPIREVL